MQITLHIADDLAQSLKDEYGPDLSRVFVERFALEGYVSRKLSRFQVQQLLGFDNRWDTEDWLGRHGARWQYSIEDLEEDRRTLDRLFGEA